MEKSNDYAVKFEWKDTETDAVGFIVLHKIINGVASGGIFMHKDATLEETVDIARNMSLKFCVTLPQIGGAKAGIRFNHQDPRAKEVLRRFILANKILLENVWVTAGDLNTDDAFIEKVITEELGLSCCQHRLGMAIAEARGVEPLNYQLDKLISHKAYVHTPLIEATVGYGLAAAIETVINHTAPELKGKARVLIQGFGAVGTNLAYYLENKDIAHVVGIADKDGFMHSQKNIYIAEMIGLRQEIINKGLVENINDAMKNIICVLKTAIKNNIGLDILKDITIVDRDPSWSNEEFLQKFLESTPAEIFSPCATSYCITSNIVKTLGNSTWKDIKLKYIASGANNPYGAYTKDGKLIEDKNGTVLNQLQLMDVCVIPDWVGNSGTAQLFHRGLSIKFDFDSKNVAQDVLEACAKPIRYYLIDVLRHCNKPVDLPTKCLNKAEIRMGYPIPLSTDDYIINNINPGHSMYLLPPVKNILKKERAESVLSVGIECIEEKQLRVLLNTCPNPVAYDGFEPSGRMHIAQGLFKSVNVNKMTEAGFTYIFWIADWFALMNHKMGGDLNKIQDVGRYFIEIWKACGMDMSRVKFLWASDEIKKRYNEYMDLVIDISNWATINDMKGCMQIMGRAEEDFKKQKSSQILYPAMQCADIFLLGVDVAQLGLDQRKVNMLARDYATAKGKNKPIILSHKMLPGLKKGQEKMSKSDPNSAIYMEDTTDEVNLKIKGAWCPEKQIEGNPCIDYLKYIVFHYMGLTVNKTDNTGKIENTTVYNNYLDLEHDYFQGNIHPIDLKTALAVAINKLLDPIRNHFQTNDNAKSLLERVKLYRITK